MFKDNYKMIQEHNLNRDEHGYTMGMNKFGDLTLQEWRDLYVQPRSSKRQIIETQQEEVEEEIDQYFETSITDQAIEDKKIPSKIDWRDRGMVNKVRDQGDGCKASYAFSAVSAIESAKGIFYKELGQLSEQQIIDCSGKFGNEGCTGGDPDNAYDYVHENPLCSRSDYSYSGQDGRCYDWKCWTSHYVKAHEDVTPRSRFALYTAIANQPVSVSVSAGHDGWKFYKEGIMKTGCTGSIDHTVTAVGYSYEPWYWFWKDNYIIVKNSWGTEWGENGYIKISSNAESGEGTCDSYEDNSYPMV